MEHLTITGRSGTLLQLLLFFSVFKLQVTTESTTSVLSINRVVSMSSNQISVPLLRCLNGGVPAARVHGGWLIVHADGATMA
jgi:hypothetical protein